MNLEAPETAGEIVAAITVAASLPFVGYALRQSQRAERIGIPRYDDLSSHDRDARQEPQTEGACR